MSKIIKKEKYLFYKNMTPAQCRSILSDGWTQAHEAALLGALPDNFNQWDLADESGWTVAHEETSYRYLPADFKQWGLTNNDGVTVAHSAAFSGKLPSSFVQWELADKDGSTVAHWAAKSGHLPDDFNRWDMLDEDGTVAHSAARYKHLPDDFNRWGLIDSSGFSVLGRFLQRHGALPDKFMERWRAEKPLCKTKADWEVFKIGLPEIYAKYTISENMEENETSSDAMSL